MKTGIIGLGVMGAGMAINLHKAGILTGFWNRTPDRARIISDATGLAASADIGTLVEQCELIITCVSRDADVIEVVEKLARLVRPGMIVVDTSTVNRDTALRAADTMAGAGADFLDCPVTGGAEGARLGTLSLMVGGSAEVLERARPALSAIGKRIVHIGPTGSGQACKAVNQVICAGINQAVTEGLAWGAHMGLDMDKVLEAISAGAAGNWFMDHRGKTMLAGTYAPGFKVGLHHKDLDICMAMAGENACSWLKLTAMTLNDYDTLIASGHADEDISALFRLKKIPGEHT